MERKNLALQWGTRVVSRDGWSGKLRGAYLAPRSGKITQVLLQRSFPRREQTAGLNGAEQRSDGTLVLSARAAQGDSSPARGSVHFSAKSVAHCSDGASVSLKGLILDSQSHEVRYLLVNDDGESRAAVMGRLTQKLNSGSPSVSVGSSELRQLPVFRSDDEAQKNAAAALEEADQSGYAYRAIEVQVTDGTAHLTGSVHMPIQKADAEKAMALAAGVLQIQNDIVADWDMEIAIAEAVAKEGLTRYGLVTVKSALGHVTLAGHLASQEMVDKAVKVAEGVAGVRSVAQEIKVRPLPAQEPAAVTVTP